MKDVNDGKTVSDMSLKIHTFTTLNIIGEPNVL